MQTSDHSRIELKLEYPLFWGSDQQNFRSPQVGKLKLKSIIEFKKAEILRLKQLSHESQHHQCLSLLNLNM